MIILGTNSIKAAGGFDVANSLRFNRGSSDNLTRSTGTATNNDKATVSFWLKRSGSNSQGIIAEDTNGSNKFAFILNSNQKIELFQETSGSTEFSVITTRVFRDFSAWYHIVIAYDSSQGTASNRIKVYVNGVQETAFDTGTYPSSNVDFRFNKNSITQQIGSYENTAYMEGYLSEFVFIDGQQLAPDQFGEFDEDSGIWKPINVSGLTFGNNGFYLDFKDSSALGNDANGSNNFTVNNLTAIDQSTDTCTNNSCVINSLDNHFYNATLSEGNLKQTANASNYSFGTSTFGVSQGKWVVEIKIESGSTVRNVMGITDKVSTGTTNELGNSGANAWQYSSGGNIYNNGSDIGGSYASFTTNDIIGIYLDLDNNKLYFSKNGTVQNSGTGISITAPSSTTNGVYFFAFGDYGASDNSVNNVNFGSPAFAISSGNTDGEYGNFEYTTTITGDSASKTFKALNTKNLAEYG